MPCALLSISLAAPVPRPPQPTRPAFKGGPSGTAARAGRTLRTVCAAAAAATEVWMKPLRVSFREIFRLIGMVSFPLPILRPQDSRGQAIKTPFWTRRAHDKDAKTPYAPLRLRVFVVKSEQV